MTLKQLAELAGVSRGTVDRVLHGRGEVDPEKAKRVWELARQVGYTPARAGRALVTKKPILIGQIVNCVGNPFFDDVLRGMEDAVLDYADFPIETRLVSLRGYDRESQAHAIEELIGQEIKALLITPINHPRIAQAVNQLSDRGCTVVTVNTDVENCHRRLYVGCNDQMCGCTAGKLLGMTTQGKGRALIVTGSLSLMGHRQRVQGFEKAIKEYPAMPPPIVVENGDDDGQSYASVNRALGQYPDVDCVYFAAAGAPGGVRAWLEHGKKGEYVVASDATPDVVALLKTDQISATICQQPYLQGYQAMKHALSMVLFSKLPASEKLYTQSEIKLKYNLQGGDSHG